MRKIVQEQEMCPKCGAVTIPETWDLFCDNCEKQIDMDRNHLMMLIFYMDRRRHSDEIAFCNWECFATWVSDPSHFEMEAISFVSLPDIIGREMYPMTPFIEHYQAFIKILDPKYRKGESNSPD